MTVENLEIEIVQQSTNASSAIDGLVESLGRLQRALGQNQIVSFTRKMTALNSSLHNIDDSAVAKIERLANALARMSELANGGKISVSVKDQQGRTTAASSTAATAATPVSAEARQLIETGTQADLLRMKIGMMQDAMAEAFNKGDTSGAIRYRENIDRLNASLNKLESEQQNAAKGTEEMAASAGRAEGMFGKLMKSLGRIAFYRAMRSVIRLVTQALKEGLDAEYEFSKATGGRLASSLDMIATKAGTLKRQLGSAFGELIKALSPIIEQVITIVTQLVTIVTQAINVIGRALAPLINLLAEVLSIVGQILQKIIDIISLLGGDYLIAEDVATAWKDADKAAGDYKRTILGFDEINKLDAPSGGGGSSGGGFGEPTGFKKNGEAATIPKLLAGILPDIENMNAMLQTQEETVGSVADAFELAAGKVAAYAASLLSLPTSLPELVVKVKTGTAISAIDGLIAKISEMKNSASENLATTSGKFDETFNGMKETAGTALGGVVQSVKNGFQNAKSNILTFCSETRESIGQWAADVSEKFAAVSQTVGEKIYEGFQSAADNVVTFINGTAKGIWQWAKGTLENFVSWANGVASSVADALSSAWDNFKDFAKKTGENISDFFSANRKTITAVAITAAVAVGAIALAPLTGGASLALAAFADGGYPKRGDLFIAGEAGAEIVSSHGGQTQVSNTDQIAYSVQEGNGVVVEAIYAMANAIVNSVDRKDTNPIVTIGDRDVYRAWERGSNAVGGSLVHG